MNIVCTYPYTDESGTLLFETVRLDPKDFRQRHRGENGQWVWSLNGTRRVLYRLQELVESSPLRLVFIVEGEKDADRLAQVGALATTAPMGANAQWLPEYSETLRGRLVCIIADNDKPGREHAEKIAKALRGIAKSVTILNLPGLPAKGDVSDWIDAGGDRSTLLQLADQAEQQQADADVPPEEQMEKPGTTTATSGATRHRPTVKNYIEKEVEVKGADGESKPMNIKVPRSFADMTTQILQITGGWPKAAGAIDGALGTLFAPINGGIAYFEKTQALLGQLFDDKLMLDWKKGEKYQSKEAFREYLRAKVEQYKAVEAFPHFPRLEGHYYHHEEVRLGDGSHLDKFLAFFNPATPLDAQLMRAFVMQLFWGGQYGARPAWLITGPDQDDQAGRGVGKTTFVQKCAALVGGMLSINNTKGDVGDIERRLLTPDAKSIRLIAIDNLKSLKFSWDLIEAMITTSIIDGRQMFVGNGRRPNSATWVMTANGATLSRDMAQRSNVLKLARPTYSAGDWDLAINEFIRRYRWQIIGDIAAAFEKRPAKVASANRWGLFVQDIIGRLPDPTDVQSLLAARAAEVDGDDDEKNLIRNALMNAIVTRAGKIDPPPERMRVRFSPGVLARIVNFATGNSFAVNKATAHVYTLGIKEMRKGAGRRDGRFHEWVGLNATDAAEWIKIIEIDERDLIERGD